MTKGKSNRHAQVSLEFVVIFTLILILFVFFAVLFFDRYVGVATGAESLDAKKRCDLLGAHLNYLYLAPSQTSVRVYVPSTLDNGDAYNVTWGQHSLILQHDNKETSCYLVTDQIIGNVTPGTYHTFVKDEGVIRIA